MSLDKAEIRSIIVLIIAALVGLTSFSYLAPHEVSFGMFSGESGWATIRFFAAFFLTLLGVLLGSAYRELKRMQSQNIDAIDDTRAFVSKIGRSIDLWLGCVASPIVFALLLQTSDGMSFPGLAVVALENGFCCHIIAAGVLAKAEADNSSSANKNQ